MNITQFIISEYESDSLQVKQRKMQVKKVFFHLKTHISELTPVLKTLTKVEKKIIGDYSDELFWNSSCELCRGVPNWMDIEKNMLLHYIDDVKQMCSRLNKHSTTQSEFELAKKRVMWMQIMTELNESSFDYIFKENRTQQTYNMELCQSIIDNLD